MKLEEILPEIRKGRRFRRAEWTRGAPFQIDNAWRKATVMGLGFNGEDMVADDWELEPDLELSYGGVYGTVTVRKGGVCFYPRDGDFVLSHELLDALHAASLKARGIEGRYVEPLACTIKDWERCGESWWACMKLAHRAGWDARDKAQ